MKKPLFAADIEWDIDVDDPTILPTVVQLPLSLGEDIDKISDYLRAETGYCHRGFYLAQAQ